MATRTTETTVTFTRPFTLSALEGVQPAGTYTLETIEDEIDGLSYVAWRRTATMLRVPAVLPAGRFAQAFPVDPAELAAALTADREDKSDGATKRA